MDSVGSRLWISRLIDSITGNDGRVVRTWKERTAALEALDGVAHVLIFENRGAAVGTSNPHPHCQIYAGALVYGTAAREAEVAAEHHRRSGRELLADVVERELEDR
jgi:UDPglucose--hexose-1-phosphate uridylyltransferase